MRCNVCRHLSHAADTLLVLVDTVKEDTTRLDSNQNNTGCDEIYGVRLEQYTASSIAGAGRDDLQKTPYHHVPVASCSVAAARDSIRSHAERMHPVAQLSRHNEDRGRDADL